jgi:hypothetical protein
MDGCAAETTRMVPAVVGLHEEDRVVFTTSERLTDLEESLAKEQAECKKGEREMKQHLRRELSLVDEEVKELKRRKMEGAPAQRVYPGAPTQHIYPDVQHTIHGGGKVQSTEADPPIVVWTCFVRVSLQSPLRQPFEGKQATHPGNPVTKNLRDNSGMALPGRSANLGAWSVWAYRILAVETSSFFKEQARTLIFKGNGNNLTNFEFRGKPQMLMVLDDFRVIFTTNHCR